MSIWRAAADYIWRHTDGDVWVSVRAELDGCHTSPARWCRLRWQRPHSQLRSPCYAEHCSCWSVPLYFFVQLTFRLHCLHSPQMWLTAADIAHGMMVCLCVYVFDTTASYTEVADEWSRCLSGIEYYHRIFPIPVVIIVVTVVPHLPLLCRTLVL